MAKRKKRIWWIVGITVMVVYFLVAARPIRKEINLTPLWVSSLNSDTSTVLGSSSGTRTANVSREFLLFRLGERFGYVGIDGSFAMNRLRQGYISQSESMWAEFSAVPSSIELMNLHGELQLTIENPAGYPFLSGERIYIVGSNQQSLSAISASGSTLWQYNFRSTLTALAALDEYVLAGTLDGSIELLDSDGKAVIPPFEVGGSQFAAVYGVAISDNAARIAVISGLNDQRFILLEYSGDMYRVIHHEFLGSGFRRPVHIHFVDGGRKVAFERSGGIGIFDIASRSTIVLPLEGEIQLLDTSAGENYLFAITGEKLPAPPHEDGQGSEMVQRKKLIAIKYPGSIVLNAPFTSNAAFLSRRSAMLYLGGDSSIAAFELERR